MLNVKDKEMETTNMIQAEYIIKEECKKYFYGNNKVGGIQRLIAREEGKEAEYEEMKEKLDRRFNEESTEWCKAYCEKHFSEKFKDTVYYKVLVGEIKRPSKYFPVPF